MNYLKRARLYLTHKKGQSLLMLLIMSAILVFVLSGIIIQNAAIMATNNVTKSAGSTITVSANRNKMFSQMRSSSAKTKTLKTPTVANTKIAKAGKLSTVAYYNITNTASVNASSFDAISTSTGTSSMGGGMGVAQVAELMLAVVISRLVGFPVQPTPQHLPVAKLN